VCCRVLPCIAIHYRVLQCIAAWHTVIVHVPTFRVWSYYESCQTYEYVMSHI